MKEPMVFLTFGSKQVVEGLAGMAIHGLENVFTCSIVDHGLVDSLQLWFEPTVHLHFSLFPLIQY